MNNNMDERLLDLLCDKATGNLSEEEARELAELSTGANADMDAQSLDLAAAAILLAETDIEEMPSHLEAKIARAADWHFAALRQHNAAAEDGNSVAAEPVRTVQWTEPEPRRSIFDWFGWGVAVAACIAS